MHAQDVEPPSQPLVAEVSYIGNEFFSDYDLFLRTRVRANREFLGIAGLRWWLWIYRLGESGRLGDRLGRALTASGEAPAIYDPQLVDADVDRLKLAYQQEGFRRAVISADTTEVNPGWVRVDFLIEEGEPTYLRTVSFDGLNRLTLDEQQEFLRETLVSDGLRYSEPLLIEERGRILDYLHNRGFASASRDSVRAVIIPSQPDSYNVRLEVTTGQRYRFGAVAFSVIGPETRQRPRDVVIDQSAHGDVAAAFSNEDKLSAALLARALRFAPGQTFNQSRVLATKRRLDATGVFAFTNATPTPRASESGDPYLDYEFEVRTRERHGFRSEWFMLQRGGALGGADAELGMGVGFSYQNANLLGSAEAFTFGVSGSIAADSDFKLFTSTQGEVNVGLSYPYLIAPFRRLERSADFYNVGSRLSLSLLTARRDQLKLIVRGRGEARLRLEMQHSPTVSSFVDVVDISLSNPDTLAGFGADFLDPLLESIKDDPIQRAQIIQDYTQPQVNDALRYTYRSARVNPLKRDGGYSYETAIEVGGLANLVLDRYAFTSGELEGSLPGLPFFRRDGSRQRLVYRPYVRAIADFRQYIRVNPSAVLAWKLIGGAAHPISVNQVVPFDRRFFSGGAFSIRGWRLGELGPGEVNLSTAATSAEATNILGGDIKLEASVEYRRTIFKRVLAAEWILAPFVDAGNVWFGPRNPGFSSSESGQPSGKFRPANVYREIGVGSGAGLRISWEYLIVRFDLAVPLYDPARRDLGFLPDGISRPLPHFGIGHTF